MVSETPVSPVIAFSFVCTLSNPKNPNTFDEDPTLASLTLVDSVSVDFESMACVT